MSSERPFFCLAADVVYRGFVWGQVHASHHPKYMHYVRERENGSTTQQLDHLPTQYGNQLHPPFLDEAGNTKEKGRKAQ